MGERLGRCRCVSSHASQLLRGCSAARRIVVMLCTIALTFGCLAPSFAFADEPTAAPSAGVTPAAQESPELALAASGSLPHDVVVSAEGNAAALADCPFAIDSFSRSQTGSNRDIAGAYHGYCYYGGSSPDLLAMVATAEYVVVYVPSSISADIGYDTNDPADQDRLKSYLIALDGANANGNVAVSATEITWYFTQEASFEVEGAVFSFAQELKTDQYYACVVGADGSDVTDESNSSYTKLTHADFGELVKMTDVNVVLPLTGFDAFVNFITTIDYSPLWVTLKTTGVAIFFIFILGLAAAYFSLRIPPRAQDIADSIFTIPMVLPPTVCGFLLLLAFGRNTGVGQWFISIGFPLIFSWQATVLAAVVVAFPLMYRSARGAFESLDSNMLDAARTLGWSNSKIFFKLMIPLSWSSIAAGTVLAFARALGEFGATLFLAGNYLGITRTIPIAIYFEWMNGNTDVALFWTVIIMIFSFIVILFINLWGRKTTKYRKGAQQ